MNIPQWAQSHQRPVLFALTAFAIAGFIMIFNIPVSLFPAVTFPRVVISIDAGDRPAERMVVEVTMPVEEAVRSVPGVRDVRSTTSRGSTDISINFSWHTDMISAMLQTESAVYQIFTSLPPGTRFKVRRMDPTVFPVLGYSLTSDNHSMVELRDFALFQLRPILSTIPGVARVGVLGGDEAEYQVMVNPARLASLGLDIQAVAQAVASANVLKAVGRLEENYKLYLVLSDSRLDSSREIEKIIIRKNQHGIIYLDDIAIIKRSVSPRWTRVTADGHDAVLFQIYQQLDGNTVKIAEDVEQKTVEISRHLPAGIHISNWYDQSRLIISSAHSVRDAIVTGVGLAAIVLFLFLRNLKITAIALVIVPVVLCTTILLLHALDMSFNTMTLGGMAAAIALVIDDAIVMIEHIIRRMQDAGGSYGDSINKSVVEFTRPLAGSSAATIIIFAPLAFISGVTGSFFKAFSLTMAAALIISFLMAWIAIPLMSLHLLKHNNAHQNRAGGSTEFFHRHYDNLMKKLFSRPFLVFAFIVPFVALGYFAFQNIGSGFIPSVDEGGFIIDYRAESGTSLTETNLLLQHVEKILLKTPDVLTYSRRTGLSLGEHITEANEGDFFVRLKPPPRRGLDVVMDELRQRIITEVPGLQIEMARLMEDLIGDLTAVPQPIEVKLFSDNGSCLQNIAIRVAESLKHVRGVVDVADGVVLAGNALNVYVNHVKAAADGITHGDVTEKIEEYLTGVVATELQEGPKMVGVRIWVPESQRSLSMAVKKLLIRTGDGHLVPLKRIARLVPEAGQPQIMRENLKRMVAVTGRISGRDMGSTIADVMKELKRPGLIPEHIYYTMGGMYEQKQIAFRGLLGVFISAVVLVFILLLYLYESFAAAFSMILTSLVAVSAVFTGLWLAGTDMNITAMMGMTMVIGIVTEIEIFFYSEFVGLDDALPRHYRLILAGRNRMRPIAMTTVAAILAFAPLSLGIGDGSAMLQPLAIAITSGLFVQIPLVLVFMPILICLFFNKKFFVKHD